MVKSVWTGEWVQETTCPHKHTTIFTVRNSSCGKVMFSQVSVCSQEGGVHPRKADTPPRWLLQRTVRILLECILVEYIFDCIYYLKIFKFLKIALRCNSVDKLISVRTSGYQKSLIHLTNASNSLPQEWIPVGYVPPTLYRTGGRSLSSGGVSDQGGGCLSGRPPFPPVDRQTPVKLLPCPKLCLRMVSVFAMHDNSKVSNESFRFKTYLSLMSKSIV